ncbi:MAG: SAM-dependent methyltransferase [Pseudolabrys sp.]|nr:SAM-dependent methyltransferase [Pseudolabrys sp.]MDP2298237.1 SAM-dependent methyltransferase [Pseudolabrys sp.]
MEQHTPLELEIRRRIAAAGPMPVDEYMGLCLAHPEHGYYVTRDPLGARGDFITAPEISQMFGELIGLWMTAVWKQMGAPPHVRVIELGPGRGTLMKDALRAAQVVPDFRDAVALHLIEISPVLEAQQERTLEPLTLPMFWHPELTDVPGGPAIIIANEFFDALPIKQAIKQESGWHERLVGIDGNGNLAFMTAAAPIPHFDRLLPASVRAAPAQSIYEWRADAAAFDLGKRLAKEGGAALVIDYGHAESGAGDTLQAVGRHAFANPLIAPGSVDLTAHVDFQALTRAAEAMGAKGYAPINQGQFLRRLGIDTRAHTLKAKASRAVSAEIDAAVLRLTGAGAAGMGDLFKVAAFTHPSLGAPPGFE